MRRRRSSPFRRVRSGRTSRPGFGRPSESDPSRWSRAEWGWRRGTPGPSCSPAHRSRFEPTHSPPDHRCVFVAERTDCPRRWRLCFCRPWPPVQRAVRPAPAPCVDGRPSLGRVSTDAASRDSPLAGCHAAWCRGRDVGFPVELAPLATSLLSAPPPRPDSFGPPRWPLRWSAAESPMPIGRRVGHGGRPRFPIAPLAVGRPTPQPSVDSASRPVPSSPHFSVDGEARQDQPGSAWSVTWATVLNRAPFQHPSRNGRQREDPLVGRSARRFHCPSEDVQHLLQLAPA